MLKQFIERKLKENFPFEPTSDQLNVFEALGEFLTNKQNNSIFLLNGFAGTGKTSLIASLVKTLEYFKQSFFLMAPTGRAAKVLSSYSGYPAFTIHKRIYRQKSSKDGFGRFVLGANLSQNSVFIVDEASMVTNESSESSVFGSGNLLSDLIDFVQSGLNCHLILVGDTAQLPPVGLSISPALDPDRLKSYGMSVKTGQLSKVIRQAADSGILHNATLIRKLIENEEGKLKFDLKRFNDIERISGEELIESISDCYSKFGSDNTLVVTRSNKRANKYNAGIRASIMGREEEICRGDFLMVVKNNYFWAERTPEIADGLGFIANGDIAHVTRLGRFTERYGYQYIQADLAFPDYQNIEITVLLLLKTLQLDGPSLPSENQRDLFYQILADYSLHTGSTNKENISKVKVDPFFNALQVKFGYAVTCHKAQGWQWKAVFIDQGFVEENLGREYYRWLYTALTRASEKVYLVNFPDKYFSD